MKFICSFLVLMFLTSSCYVYRVPELEEGKEPPKIEQEIQKDKIYSFYSGGQTYKVKAVEWEGDSLVAHVNRKEDKEMKFHKKDISQVAHRQFSRGRSDALTFGFYGLVGALVVFLTQ